MKAPQECGTYGGMSVHRRRGELICADCQRAAADYMRQYRRRTGRSSYTIREIEEWRVAASLPFCVGECA